MVMPARNFTPSAIPEDFYNPYYLGLHRKAVMGSMYGLNNILKVDVIDGRVKFILNTTGQQFDTMETAFVQAGRTGATTFARLTGDLATSSDNLRGLSGIREQLINIQDSLARNPSIATNLGIDDPSKLFFEVGSFKLPLGQKGIARNVLSQLEKGFALADDGTFNVLRVFKGPGSEDELTIAEISRLFMATSPNNDGLLPRDELIRALKSEGDASQKLAGLFQKSGKRVKGAIALKDVSLAGGDLQDVLRSLGTGQTSLNEKTVRVFKPGEDLMLIAERYLRDTTKFTEPELLSAFDIDELRKLEKYKNLSETELKKISSELKAFYSGNGSVQATIARLETLEIKNILDLDKEGGLLRERLVSSTESAYDGTSVINSKAINAMKKAMKAELEELSNLTDIGDKEIARMRELTSQLDNLQSGNFEAVTGRVFMTVDGKSRMIKAVFDQSEFKSPLRDYAILTTDVVLKKETSVMGQTDSINLVLQGEPSKIVYQDPLMPGYHYGLFDENFEKAQNARNARILSEYRNIMETGQISSRLKKRIYQDAGMDISGLPEAVRDQQSRNKLFAQKLRDAIESGADIRTMPQLLNYLKKHTESQLFKLKDGVYLPALDDAFRFAIDTEESFYKGRNLSSKARLGAGLETITLSDGRQLKAATFQIQGHKMLFGGDAANIFKQSLGGFDLDDKGIVMPRIFESLDSRGKKTQRLGTFIFRQPTGPSEFIFAKANLENVDTINAFLGDNDAFANVLDDFKKNTTKSDADKRVFSLLKNIIDGVDSNALQREIDLIAGSDNGAIERAIIETMIGAKKYGYQYQTIDPTALFPTLESGKIAAGVKFGKEELQNLIASGFTKDRMEEKFLVEQYREGFIRRTFVEKGAFAVDNEFQASIKSAVGESIYNSSLSGLENQRDEFLNKLGSLMESDRNLADKIHVAVESTFATKSKAAIESSDNIGTYINRLTVAAAGSDQMDDIIGALEGKVSASVLDKIKKQYIMAVSPSDIVDLIVNLNGTNEIGLERSAEVMRAFYEGATDRAAAKEAIESIMNLRDATGKSLVDATGIQMIEGKGKLIGSLRALSMRYLDETERTQLLAGMDKEILRQRLSGSDVSTFINSLQAEYRRINSDLIDLETGKMSDTADAALRADYERLLALTGGSEQDQQAKLIDYLGLGHESNYAHFAKSARIGQQAKDSLDAETARLSSRMTTSFASEINMSADAVELSENILKQYDNMLQQNSDVLERLTSSSDDLAELYKAQKTRTLSLINDRVYSMIYQAAENNPGVTVGQLADNMEFIMNSRYPRLRSLMTGQIFDEKNSVLSQMFYGAQQERRIRDANRQGRSMSLVDEYNDMIDSLKADSSTKDTVIEEFRQSIDRFNRTKSAASLSDELLTSAAAIYQFGEKDFSILELSAENEQMVRNLIQDANARRYLAETKIDDLLSFGGGTGAERFAPSDISRILSDEESRAISLGTEAVGDVSPASYKRLTKESLGQMFENPTLRKGGYAAVGLVAASFLYSAAKDRSQQDMTGPPLLPGGSAYESLAQRQPQVPNVSMFSGYNEGTSYAVNIEGSKDQIDSFSSVAGGNGSSTIYRGIPQLGRDPYSMLAGSF